MLRTCSWPAFSRLEQDPDPPGHLAPDEAICQRRHRSKSPAVRSVMSRLSACIFEWDQEDVHNLCRARAAELDCDESTARRLLTRKQLALHCRRQTRGAEDTTELIDELIESLRGDKGLDTLGMPLFDQPLMDHIWSVEKKHIHCIQDPVGIQLYIQTGTVKRGGAELPTYRCSRGSVSLESFHLHITRFVPGMWLLGMVVMHYGAFSVHK